MGLDNIVQKFWDEYSKSETLPHGHVESAMAGTLEKADKILTLFLNGKKTASSSLVKDFKLANEPSTKGWKFLDRIRL